jgi:hypothetical protein
MGEGIGLSSTVYMSSKKKKFNSKIFFPQLNNIQAEQALDSEILRLL